MSSDERIILTVGPIKVLDNAKDGDERRIWFSGRWPMTESEAKRLGEGLELIFPG